MAANLNTEILLAILPLNRLLKPYDLIVGPRDLLKVSGFESAARQLIMKLVKDKPISAESDLTVQDTKKLLDTVLLPLSDLAMASVITNLDSQDLDGISISQNIKSILDIAKGFKPNQDMDLPVSNSQLTKLTWVLRIIDNPLHVFNLMANSQLTNIDANTLQMAYPNLYGALSQLLVQELINTGKPLTRQKKLMLSIFFQIPTVTPEVLQAYLKPTSNTKADLNVAATGA